MTVGARADRRDARLRIDRFGFLANRDLQTNRATVATIWWVSDRRRGHAAPMAVRSAYRLGAGHWQYESGYSVWNVYEGDLDVLRATGTYTQLPGSNALASRICHLVKPWWGDITPLPGKVKFALVTGDTGGVESSLGTNSAGVPRANANPCP